MFVRMTELDLTPELQEFAENCVRSGRYDSVTRVAEAAMRLLQKAEAERTAFIAMLEESEAEGETDGFLTIEQVGREMDEVIETAIRTRA